VSGAADPEPSRSHNRHWRHFDTSAKGLLASIQCARALHIGRRNPALARSTSA
jgi:hypothetical protein